MNTTRPLTRREAEILGLVARGKEYIEVGAELGISSRTVANHVIAILNKLQATNRAQAVAIAMRDGLIAA